MKWMAAALVSVMAALVQPSGAAFFIRSLDNPRDRREARTLRPEAKAVVLEGLRGAAEYGTASALKAAGVSGLAKTGSIVMPNGTALGLVVVLTPAEKPTRAIVVAAPGAAGLDAASLAADLLKTPLAPTPLAPQAPPAPKAQTIPTGPNSVDRSNKS